jgi:hypothetical protein
LVNLLKRRKKGLWRADLACGETPPGGTGVATTTKVSFHQLGRVDGWAGAR